LEVSGVVADVELSAEPLVLEQPASMTISTARANR